MGRSRYIITMRRGRLLALAAAALLSSPVATLVVLRYIFLDDGSVGYDPTNCTAGGVGVNGNLTTYGPSLLAGTSSALGFPLALGWLLFSTYRRRGRWPRACGLAAQAAVPPYLHGGDLFLLQLPFCAAQYATIRAMAEPEMTAPRAVVAAYGAALAGVALTALLPAPRCCRAGGGRWATEAARHGRGGVLLSMLLCLGAVFAFLFTSHTSAAGFGLSFSGHSYVGYALLGGAQLCGVGRNAMARCLIRRNARQLHAPPAADRLGVAAPTAAAKPVAAVEAPAAEPENEPSPAGADGGDAPAEVRGAEKASALGEEDEDPDSHLFRGLEEEELAKLDSVFTTPLYLRYPLAVGTVNTFELAQLGGNILLAPAAALLFFWSNSTTQLSDWPSHLSAGDWVCCGWLAVSAVLHGPLCSELALAAPPSSIAYMDVVGTAVAALVGWLALGCLDSNSPELPGPPQLGAMCVFALAAAVGLAARGRAAEEAASQQQLLYLAEALPNLSAVQMEDLMRVRLPTTKPAQPPLTGFARAGRRHRRARSLPAAGRGGRVQGQRASHRRAALDGRLRHRKPDAGPRERARRGERPAPHVLPRPGYTFANATAGDLDAAAGGCLGGCRRPKQRHRAHRKH